MKDIEVIARGLAKSIVAVGSKFNAAEHAVALGEIVATSKPADIGDNVAAIGNISAVSQMLKSCGAITSDAKEHTALQRQVLVELGKLRAAKK